MSGVPIESQIAPKPSPGTLFADHPERAAYLLVVQGGVLLCGYLFLGGDSYPCYWPLAALLLATMYFLSWALRRGSLAIAVLGEGLQEYLERPQDAAHVLAWLGHMRSLRLNRAMGVATCLFVTAELLYLQALPVSRVGLLAAFIVIPALYIAGEGWYQVVAMVVATHLLASKDEVRYDKLRPSRVPILKGFESLHGFVVRCFLCAGAGFVAAYAIVAVAVIPPEAHSSPVFALSWLILFVFVVITFPSLAVLPRRALLGRTAALRARSIREIEAERNALLLRPHLSAGMKMLVAYVADFSIRSIEGERDRRKRFLTFFLPLIADIASILALLVAAPPQLFHVG